MKRFSSFLFLFVLIFQFPSIVSISSMDLLGEYSQKQILESPSYSSTVRILFPKEGRIESMEVEEYLVGVLMGEAYSDYSPEALKAIAVAARSYTLYMCEKSAKKPYDVVADSMVSQAYVDISGAENSMTKSEINKYNVMKNAVDSTSNEIAVFNNEVICAFYHASSCDTTENCDNVFIDKIPYLKSVESYEWGDYYYSETVFSFDEFVTLLKNNLYPSLDTSEINIEQYKNENGRCNGLYLYDGKVGFTIDKSKVRNLLGLKSTSFDVTITDKITFEVYGYGHGVGLSQNGANNMGNLGFDYTDIIEHYYSGSKIIKTIYK